MPPNMSPGKVAFLLVLKSKRARPFGPATLVILIELISLLLSDNTLLSRDVVTGTSGQDTAQIVAEARMLATAEIVDAVYSCQSTHMSLRFQA